MILAAALPAAGEDRPAAAPGLLAEGQQLYEKQCALCHGLTGAGDGPAAYLLYPKPRDFTRNEFRLVSTSTMEAADEDLFLAITRGMPGSAMPSWEALTEKERWALVGYVRKLTGSPAPSDPASIVPVPRETPSNAKSAGRGRALFSQGCASCHGLQGKGDGQQVMQDNQGFPIRPRNLTAGIFKGSSQSADLYRRIIAGLPGSPMPSYAGAYTDEQVWDLVHFVQSLAPPGAEERARLARRTIRASRLKGEIPLDPMAPAWKRIKPAAVNLTPLWWRDDRIESVEVRCLHNGEALAFHLTWSDAARDNSTLTPQSFSDGAAIQLSAAADPPFFGMGDRQAPVWIWNWKALPETPQAAEEANAKGPGTLTSREARLQQVQARGLWQDGRWRLVFLRPISRNQEDLPLAPGATASAAFAIFDGAHQDRNGQKNVSIWNELQLEP
ncbi:MAG: c-type cytochrome [Candidatus Omnitrophica bacterium]|nr:c-type cytochrome [Candidatus Omnitrophota bacterium]